MSNHALNRDDGAYLPQRNICISLAGDVIPWVFKKPRLQIFKLFHLLSFRYRGYRDKPMSIKENPYGNLTNNYDFTKDYWHILSAQLFFVIAFLVSDFHIVCNIAFTSKCLVPIQGPVV